MKKWISQYSIGLVAIRSENELSFVNKDNLYVEAFFGGVKLFSVSGSGEVFIFQNAKLDCSVASFDLRGGSNPLTIKKDNEIRLSFRIGLAFAEIIVCYGATKR